MKGTLAVFIKGMMMGAADVVPGVSGGTIAFISGIYERLINAVRSVLPALLLLFREARFALFWQTVDGNFLLCLLAGILTSVMLFARLIGYLLAEHPVLIWSFFFGLIVASVHLVARDIARWRGSLCLLALLGLLVGWLVTEMSPAQISLTPMNLFLSGMIAICAMILPGISGSFILLLLGTYGHVLNAVKVLDLQVIGVFAAGCVVGLLSIANLLSWAFRHYREQTLAVLTGIMVGALNKVWPWKQVVSWREDSHGGKVPFLDQNVLPATYTEVTGADPLVALAILSALCGVALVLMIELMGRRSTNPAASNS